MTKRTNPYTRLQEIGRKFFSKVARPKKCGMFTLANARKGSVSYRMDDIYQRVEAAKQLGYEVVIETSGDDLLIKYVEKRPEYSDLPYEFK